MYIYAAITSSVHGISRLQWLISCIHLQFCYVLDILRKNCMCVWLSSVFWWSKHLDVVWNWCVYVLGPITFELWLLNFDIYVSRTIVCFHECTDTNYADLSVLSCTTDIFITTLVNHPLLVLTPSGSILCVRQKPILYLPKLNSILIYQWYFSPESKYGNPQG